MEACSHQNSERSGVLVQNRFQVSMDVVYGRALGWDVSYAL